MEQLSHARVSWGVSERMGGDEVIAERSFLIRQAFLFGVPQLEPV